MKNGARAALIPNFNPKPVVRLSTSDAEATCLLAEVDPAACDRAFGLCDLGLGEPEPGFVSLAELAALRGRLGLKVERDLNRQRHPSL